MFFFDPMYFVFMVPALLLALWAQYKVKSTFAKYAQVPNMHKMSGLEVAQTLMHREQLQYLKVNGVPGQLTDFYNPADKSINLSESSRAYPSIGAMAVVAHELGHAAQDKDGYLPMRIRGSIVGIANIGSSLGVWLVIGGVLISAFAGGEGGFGMMVAQIGLILFAAAVAFTLVTLPVELNASTRAREMLLRNGLVSAQDQEGVKKVLNAAALTYIAAAAQAIAQFLYLAYIVFGRRD